MYTTRPKRRPAGYTLIEVLIVVTIIGLVGAIVVPHMLATGTMGIQAAARHIVADLLYAQNEAYSMQSPRKVVFDVDTNSYRITDSDDNTIYVAWKGGEASNYVINFDEDRRFTGVEITSVNFDGGTDVEFDDLGSPDSGGTIELEFKETKYRVTVAAFTGRITVERVTGG